MPRHQNLLRPPTVVVSDHAWGQYLERAKRTRTRFKKRIELVKLLEALLFEQLISSAGVQTVSLVAYLDIGGLRAVLCLGDEGWVTATFLKPWMVPKEQRPAGVRGWVGYGA